MVKGGYPNSCYHATIRRVLGEFQCPQTVTGARQSLVRKHQAIDYPNLKLYVTALWEARMIHLDHFKPNGKRPWVKHHVITELGKNYIEKYDEFEAAYEPFRKVWQATPEEQATYEREEREGLAEYNRKHPDKPAQLLGLNDYTKHQFIVFEYLGNFETRTGDSDSRAISYQSEEP